MSQDQQIFSTAILSLQSPVPAGLTNGCGKVANRRFSVYRNNVMDSLIKALQTGFPVISKLLGEQNFKNIAGLFVRQHPPASPVINQYGDNFPAFLKDFKPLEHLPYLADTAHLEFALRRSYHAADAKSVHPSEIDALSPEQLNAAELKMSPCAFLIRCLIPWFDGAIYSLEWKEALWDKFVMGAPRLRTPSEQQYSDRKLRTRR